MIQQELRRQEDVRTSMMTQLEQAMNGLINAGDGVWDGIKGEGAEMAISLVKDMRDSQAKMMMGLSQEVSSFARSRQTTRSDAQLRASLSNLAAQVRQLIGSSSHADTYSMVTIWIFTNVVSPWTPNCR